MSRSIDGSIRNFRNNLVQLANSNEHNITQDLNAEISGILSALDSLKLDNMFMADSNTMRSQTEPRALQNHQAGLLNLLGEGDGMIYELRNSLGKHNMATLQENENRNINYVAKQRLRGFLHKLNPYSHKSYVRLENYANELGLRNRFKTIRNELDNKNEDKFKTWLDWTDKRNPEAPKYNTPNWREHNFGQRHPLTDSDRYENKASITSRNVTGGYYTDTRKYEFPLYEKQETRLQEHHLNNEPAPSARLQRSNTSIGLYQRPEVNYSSMGNYEDNNTWKKHATEAGINVNYPGTTEQKYRYQAPNRKEYTNFTLNPQPDISRFDRPFTTQAYFTNSSEYQARYKYPDGNQIDKFPWIKQY